MLNLQHVQLASMEKAAEEDFVRRAVAHLREFFTEKFVRAGELKAYEFVRHVVLRARGYDIVSEQDVCLFLDLVVTFGWDFDRRYAWAQSLLAEPGYGSGSTRLALLFEAALWQCGPGSAAAANGPGG